MKLIRGDLALYIQHQASTIFYYNLNEPKKKPKIDIQLISGFLNATSLFFDNLGFPSDSNLFQIIRGSTELRMHLGNDIHGTLILQGLPNLNEKAYMELDELLKSVIRQFEREYIDEIEAFITEGRHEFKGMDAFIKNQCQKMRAHIYSSYLMRILGLAINYNVKRKQAQQFLIDINHLFQTNLDFFTIYTELDNIRES